MQRAGACCDVGESEHPVRPLVWCLLWEAAVLHAQLLQLSKWAPHHVAVGECEVCEV